eukprot:TRINITY_DN4558_c0_g2_i2.p1 TRINITY_DN4558_c0_g2~~TRINITY_DN4558_c0_g2_i2.p1  ORF type:complete len:364 (-),score=95.65 TRINITY_DN4558_c0_g2_i2:21-1076(-)
MSSPNGSQGSNEKQPTPRADKRKTNVPTSVRFDDSHEEIFIIKDRYLAAGLIPKGSTANLLLALMKRLVAFEEQMPSIQIRLAHAESELERLLYSYADVQRECNFYSQQMAQLGQEYNKVTDQLNGMTNIGSLAKVAGQHMSETREEVILMLNDISTQWAADRVRLGHLVNEYITRIHSKEPPVELDLHQKQIVDIERQYTDAIQMQNNKILRTEERVQQIQTHLKNIGDASTFTPLPRYNFTVPERPPFALSAPLPPRVPHAPGPAQQGEYLPFPIHQFLPPIVSPSQQINNLSSTSSSTSSSSSSSSNSAPLPPLSTSSLKRPSPSSNPTSPSPSSSFDKLLRAADESN